MKNKDANNIALVSNTSWSIYNFRKGLIVNLIQQGYHVIIIAPEDGYQSRLEDLGCSFVSVKLKNYSINPFWDLYYFLQLYFILQQQRIDFLITYTIKPNIYGSLAARLLRIPNLSAITGLGLLFIKDNWKTKVAKILYRFSLKKTKQVWFLNREDRRTFVRLRIVKPEQTFILPSEGVNTRYFQRDKFIGRRPHFSFLFAGRLIPEKGIYDFVEAARLVRENYPEVSFDVLGFIGKEFPSAISLEQLRGWEKEGLITYHGSTDHIKHFLNKTDCVVLPSYYKEGVPRILLEAASMEIPIITTDNVGCREVIHHDWNGYVCKNQDPASLAYWMEQLISCSVEQRDKMGQNGRELILQKYDECFIINYYLEAFHASTNLETVPATLASGPAQSVHKFFTLQNKYRNFPGKTQANRNSKIS